MDFYEDQKNKFNEKEIPYLKKISTIIPHTKAPRSNSPKKKFLEEQV